MTKPSSQLIDRRGFLKLLQLLAFASIGGGLEKGIRRRMDQTVTGKPSILMILFDSLTAENMSLHGYFRDTTPHINRFAQKATVYHRHQSAGNMTVSGTASLLTGTYPWSHRAFHYFSRADQVFRDRNVFALLKDDYHLISYTHNIMAEVLLYDFCRHIHQPIPMGDLALVSELVSETLFPADFNDALRGEQLIRGLYHYAPASLFLSVIDKISRASHPELESFRSAFPRGVPTNENGLYFTLEDVMDFLIREIQTFPDPFLAYFHLYPPHDPYTPRQEFIGLFGDSAGPAGKPLHFFNEGRTQEELLQSRQQYDEYVAYADAEFGRLVDHLEAAGWLDDNILILTSDHGESFERGILGHNSSTLFQPLTHIPLLIHHPGQTQRVDIHTNTSSVDLLPTLLRWSGKPIPDWVEGTALPETPDERSRERIIYAMDAKFNPRHRPLEVVTVSAWLKNQKLVHYRGYEGFDQVSESFDLWSDPGEESNVVQSSAAAQHLLEAVREKLSTVNARFSA